MNRLNAFNTIAGNPVVYHAVGETADDTAAIIYLQPSSKATGTVYPGIIDWAVALKTRDAWVIYLPGDPDYTTAYNQLPDDVLAQASADPYILHADPSLAGDLSGYQFPWVDGNWGTVTRSYTVHGTGRIDFALARPRQVTAAKDGTIVYVNDTHQSNAYASDAWWYWNTIIIQHGEHEFSLYGHLAPGSIPAWITAGCSADISAPNCHVPVKAGQVIAQEGSTGYSSAPHLHFETGQAFGVVAYMDTADDNKNGVRAEPIYTGYIYAEQNVGISGYPSDEVAQWPRGTILQATHSAALAPAVNLIQNGDFSAGKDDWTASGQLNWSVQDSTMQITRLRTSAAPNWASFYQNIAGGVPAHTPFTATLRLGNSSSVAKTVTVSVYNRSGRQYGSIDCVFSLAPKTTLTEYTLQGLAVNSWASARFEVGVNPPDGSPAALVDDISLQVDPAVTKDECITGS